MTTRTRGFTLIETLTYGAGLVVILGGIVAFIVALYGWYRDATVPARVDQAGIDLVNRITNDIRISETVNAAGTVQNAQLGSISLNQVATTTKYTLENGVMKYKLNSTATTTASPTDLYVSGFYVRELPTGISTAVRIEVNIDYWSDAGTTTAIFNGLAVLRQSYE
jgi:hypothetical protein